MKAIIWYIYNTGNYLSLQWNCSSQINMQGLIIFFFGVVGMTLFFLLLIFSGCLRNVIWRYLFKMTKLCSKILLFYPLTKFGDAYYIGITLSVCLSVRLFVCLCNHVQSKSFLLRNIANSYCLTSWRQAYLRFEICVLPNSSDNGRKQYEIFH